MIHQRSLMLLLSASLLGACATAPRPRSGVIERAACEVDALAEEGAANPAATDFCVHEVTAMTPIAPGNNCNPSAVGFAVGDRLCINCTNGVCRATTTFDTDDGVWLTACRVDTSRANSACRQNWPRGTCKSYVTVP